MTANPLGRINVATPGTPVQLASSSTIAQRVRVQPRKNASTVNTGNVYLITIGTGGKGTATTIYAVLSPEQVEGLELFPVGSNVFDLSLLYVDADTAADAVLVGYL